MMFENFLESKNDTIDCAAFDLLCVLSTNKDNLDESSDSPISWDMEMIGGLVDFAEDLLTKKNKPVCRPFFEGDEETPCYLGVDCKRKDCILRQKGTRNV